MELVDELPPGLADLPPGLELAIALSRIDPARVGNHDRATVALARRRRLTHHQALLLAETVELGRCAGVAASGPRLSRPSQWAGGEIAALFTRSERAARAELDFAEQVVTHLPWSGSRGRGRGDGPHRRAGRGDPTRRAPQPATAHPGDVEVASSNHTSPPTCSPPSPAAVPARSRPG